MIPLAFKKLLPFYTWRWRRRYRAMLRDLAAVVPELTFGQEGEVPWIEHRQAAIRLHGFWTEPKNAEVYNLLGTSLPASLPKSHFRLVKDWVTRFLYPHMRPDLRPSGSLDELWGFHGQHRDAIADLPDAGARQRLTAAFQPKPGETIIDGGAFLGIGDLRMHRDMGQGRIIAVEANRACYDLLCRNAAFNHASGIVPVHAALWNAPGTLELGVGYAQANSLIPELNRAVRTEQVEAVTIDALVERLGLTRIDMISLTLNGAEVETLDGAQRTLRELRPRVRLPGWYLRDGRPIWRHAQEKLERHGYEVFVGPRGSVMALAGN